MADVKSIQQWATSDQHATITEVQDAVERYYRAHSGRGGGKTWLANYIANYVLVYDAVLTENRQRAEELDELTDV